MALKTNPDVPVLIGRYEDLKRDCMSQLHRVCDFLNLYRSDAFLQEVVVKNDISKVTEAKEANPEVQQIVSMLSLDGSLHEGLDGVY